MQGGIEVIAMIISAVIGFVAGIVATILLRESPRTTPSTSPRHRTDYDTGAQPIVERGWGRVQTRSATPLALDLESEPHQAVHTTSQQSVISQNATAKQLSLMAAMDPVPSHVTTRSGAPVAMLQSETMGKRWLLRAGESASIGRFDDNAIAIDDEEVSRLHAQISHRTDTGEVHEFTIFDYTSTNGTLVNGKPIRGVASLQDGDVVKIGNTELRFRRVSKN
jgi:hypothetical protein